MESVNTAKLTEREQLLFHWIKSSCGYADTKIEAMTPDASFRRYYRIFPNSQTYVVMDAPPPERCAAFVAIADSLRAIGLITPNIYQADLQRGFLLLTDFGNTTYLKGLNSHNANQLYTQALNALSTLQSLRTVTAHPIPPFTREFMWQEWAWHKEWFLQGLCGFHLDNYENTLDQCYAILVESAASQPQVFMHRDFHSANLMVLAGNAPGILDFQDAFIGPVTYDLASLLRDCYIAWPSTWVNTWVTHYWENLRQREVIDVEFSLFERWFDLMGVQRHIKALFTFARKKIRDRQAQYLQHIPRVLNYIEQVSVKYPEIRSLCDFYSRQVKPLCEP